MKLTYNKASNPNTVVVKEKCVDHMRKHDFKDETFDDDSL